MPKTIALIFDGYYREAVLPPDNHNCSGIYVVYAGKKTESGCSLRKLLYIGESEKVATRPSSDHEKYEEWIACLNEGEILYFSFADVSPTDRERVEAALIYHHQPPCNIQGTESFDYNETKITTSGNNKFLEKEFVE
jgi:hypothetical protein